MSVNATHGIVDVANFQLLSNTGTFQLDVQVSFVAAVHRLALLAGVYHNAVVTSLLLIHVINPLSLFKSEILSHGCTAVAHSQAPPTTRASAQAATGI